uniref:Uncharacterized protein n=1 Tax=Siphoviridae sp. ct9lR64 TaxID=2826178 RepID=A0A8S5QYD0_9CAUD|nr:MAG TPA: hypothetical protein [Siphoviridae sp. ct9lR64]
MSTIKKIANYVMKGIIIIMGIPFMAVVGAWKWTSVMIDELKEVEFI